MAYLKGNSFVDGSLYVNDALYVTTLTSSQGKIPTIAKDNSGNQLIQGNRLIKYYGTTNGSLVYSSLEETITKDESKATFSALTDYNGTTITKLVLKANNVPIEEIDASTSTNISVTEYFKTKIISNSSITIYGQSSSTDSLTVNVPKTLEIKGNSSTGTVKISSDTSGSTQIALDSNSKKIDIKTTTVNVNATTLNSTTPTSISIGNTSSAVDIKSSTIGVTASGTTGISVTTQKLTIVSTTTSSTLSIAISAPVDKITVIDKSLTLDDTTWKWSY